MDDVLFVAFPYLAVILAVGVGLYRFFRRRFTYSSASSQLLENAHLYWGSVPWHYGITLILLAHVVGLILPGPASRALAYGAPLFVLEGAGIALALFAALGLVFLVARRMGSSRARAVTSPMDGVLLFALLVQVVTGVLVALFQRWGSLWYLSTAVPWIWSLARLQPDASAVLQLPALIRFHFLWGFLLVLLIPFTRLVHLFVLPVQYLWRPYQLVVWYRGQREVNR